MAITTTTLKLCSIPELSIDYTNTLDFANITNQINFFTSRLQRSFVSKISTDSTKQTIIIEADLNEINNCDYLFFSDAFGKFYFYFITSKKYKTSSTTELFLELDVYQTYLFDFTLKDSFVDRCHVNRWTSNGYPAPNNIIEEGLEFGEHIITKIDKLYPLGSNYLITATNPLGTLGENTPPITDDEKEINREFGFNPSNPIPEWPSDNGGGENPNIPEPPENSAQTSENSLTPNDKNNIIFNYQDSFSSSSAYVYDYYIPLTAGEYGISKPNTEEDWIAEMGSKIYDFGDTIITNNNQSIYNPIRVSYKTNPNVIKDCTVHMKGSGLLPSGGIIRESNYDPRKFLLTGNFGNWVILKYPTIFSNNLQYYDYLLIGFMKEPFTKSVGDIIQPFEVIGETGDIPFLTGSKKGIYFKYFNDYIDKIENYFGPYDIRVLWKGFKFGPQMFREKPGNLDEFTTTNEVFGDDVYIPCKIGNVGAGSGNQYKILNNLTTTQNVNTFLVAPNDCVVECAASKVGNEIKTEFSQMIKTTLYASHYSYNYVILKFSSTIKMVIYGLSFFNVKEGDILEKGDIIGTFRNLQYMSNTNVGNTDKNFNLYTPLFNPTLIGPYVTPLPYLTIYPAAGLGNTTPQWGILTPEQLLLKDKEELDNIYREKVLSDPNLIPLLNVLNQEEKIE